MCPLMVSCVVVDKHYLELVGTIDRALVGIGLGTRSWVEIGKLVCETVEEVLGWIEDFGILLDEIGNLSSPHSSN